MQLVPQRLELDRRFRRGRLPLLSVHSRLLVVPGVRRVLGVAPLPLGYVLRRQRQVIVLSRLPVVLLNAQLRHRGWLRRRLALLLVRRERARAGARLGPLAVPPRLRLRAHAHGPGSAVLPPLPVADIYQVDRGQAIAAELGAPLYTQATLKK